jgi:hypothetical protein
MALRRQPLQPGKEVAKARVNAGAFARVAKRSSQSQSMAFNPILSRQRSGPQALEAPVCPKAREPFLRTRLRPACGYAHVLARHVP